MGLRTVTDENGEEKQGFVCFSLGNFISAQNDPYTDTTAVLNLTLTKDMETGETTVSGYGYAPSSARPRERRGMCGSSCSTRRRRWTRGGVSEVLAASSGSALRIAIRFLTPRHDPSPKGLTGLRF